jgi:hypothetical protein
MGECFFHIEEGKAIQVISREARVWLMRAAGIAAVLLVLYFATGYLTESARVRVTLDNTADFDMFAVVFLDSGHEDAESSGVLAVAAHAQISIGFGYVHAGDHTILVWWSPAAWGWPPSGLYNYSHDYYIMPYTTEKVVVDIGQT